MMCKARYTDRSVCAAGKGDAHGLAIRPSTLRRACWGGGGTCYAPGGPLIAPSCCIPPCVVIAASVCAPSGPGSAGALGSDSSGRRNVAAAAQAAAGGPAVRQDARRRRWRQLLCGGQARAGRQPVWRNPAAPRTGGSGLSIATIGPAWEAATARHPAPVPAAGPPTAPAAIPWRVHILSRRVQRSRGHRRGAAAAPLPAARAAAVPVDRLVWLAAAADPPCTCCPNCRLGSGSRGRAPGASAFTPLPNARAFPHGF